MEITIKRYSRKMTYGEPVFGSRSYSLNSLATLEQRSEAMMIAASDCSYLMEHSSPPWLL